MMLGLWLALAPVVPSAERPRPAALELAWEAPAGCPDADAMRRRIAATILDPDGEGTLSVEGRVERFEAGYRLTLRTAYDATPDERVVEDRDCDALGDAAVLVVAVSIDPLGEPDGVPDVEREHETEHETEREPERETEREPEREREREPEPTSRAPIADAPTREAAPSPRRARRVQPPATIALGIGGQVESGALPRLSGGPRLELDAQWQRLSIAAHGVYGAPRRTEAVQGVSGLAQIAAAGVRGCGVLGRDVRVPLCAALEGGGLRVASRGPVPDNVLRYAWTAAGVHVGLEHRWGPVGLYAAGEALVPLRRPRIDVGETTSFTASAVSVRAVLGLRIFFDTDPA